jgi:signal transduction histidine kinase
MWRDSLLRRFITASDPGHKVRFVAITCALVLVIGFADYLTGVELSLLVFYLIPVCMAVAAVGWRFGVAVSVLSVATWFGGDILAERHAANLFVLSWNAVIALFTYLTVAWLLASLLALHREMGERVRQRTAALTEEIAERVRLEKVVLEITERERRTIGHELHDGLSQHLTGTALVAQAAAARIGSRFPDEAAELGKIVNLIEQGIEQTRRLAKGLLLAEIERDGLLEALGDLAAKTRAQWGVDCRLEAAAAPDLGGSGTATHLYRIAEEATRNGIRHGRARAVSIRLVSDSGSLILRIEDDGTGIPAHRARGAGLGLRIMAHRAAIIGATFSARPRPGGGTVVECRLPHL